MRLKFLLFVILLWGGAVTAQDTIKYLVITEYRGDNTNYSYLELTNMGDKPVQLNQFHIGHWGGGDILSGGITTRVDYPIPVDKLLAPGESFVFASIAEYSPKKFAQGLEGFTEKLTQDNMWAAADFYVYLPEPRDDGSDIVTPGLSGPFNEQWGPGMNGFYIEQHFPNGDTVVVDQVGGMFTGENGTNPDRTTGSGYDIAGVTRGTGTCYLIRKFSVKQGNLNFNSARGVGLDDSEWIPIPIHDGAWRWAPWTVGNQGNYNLDENTLESDVIDVDFTNKTLTVPWGIQRGDDIMRYFKQKPGVGWEYKLSPVVEDSLSHAIHTGDQLLVYVCGNDLDLATFNIIVKDPAADAKMVVPVSNEDPIGNWRSEIDNGEWAWPRITQHESGMDTIWGVRGGIPYATRIDSLLERLEKPANAEWEIVFTKGIEKPDLTNGDILKITAQDASVKEYYISVLDYRASNNAYLSSITWPDIPEFYKGLYGWIGDTIPNFGSGIFNYNIQVPMMAEGIPALIAKTDNTNAKVNVGRAKNLSGTIEDQTISFTVTAEDDTTINNYKVVLTKEILPEHIQPFKADPFISEVIINDQWAGNDFLELCNPGNQPLDLSKYMIVGAWSSSPAEAIGATNETNWLMRYEKYIPGYKWQTEGDWFVTPYIAEQDISVNSIVQPGDVFCMGAVAGEWANCIDDYEWPPLTQLDVQFFNTVGGCHTFVNQWHEDVAGDGTPMTKWHSQQIYLFKILNDSIQKGLKPATDPNDFELIDVLGMGDGTTWSVGGVGMDEPFNFIRKPGIFKGNTNFKGSFGTTRENAEWFVTDRPYWQNQGFGWPWDILNVNNDLGKHFFTSPTHYKSTVSSVLYKVSDGYSMNENIKGMKTGETVSNFMDNIIKANPMQTLKVLRGDTELAMDVVLNMGDVLKTMSADSSNTTQYVLEVSDEGLGPNAILTSNMYTIEIQSQPNGTGDEGNAGAGTVTGFEYGTSLKTILANIVIPAGARMDIIDADGAYVPLTQLNFDTAYVNVTVNSNTYLDVKAENGVTEIIYQLLPQSSESDAFITSTVYSVVQKDIIIQYVPRGTNVQSFLGNLVPNAGSSIKLVNKMGQERIDGAVADDDKVIVISSNGDVSTVYYISMLAEKYVPGTTYLAFIQSKIYAIDQVDYIVDGVSGTELITDFYAKITASFGATAVVLDKDGNEKTSGDIDRTDMVKVTSVDGKIEVMYSFGTLTATEKQNAISIEMYPNPTNDRLNISGVERGNRIQVFNSVGAVIRDIQVKSNIEEISLQKASAGIYMIVISDKNRTVGKYKAIKY
ncbi:MAG: T9SS type A sorting domain-containing protein [Draconibacterium sp.]|nr:T9SS type A sorting domain-containing protein [Draconibacterium sp.]